VTIVTISRSLLLVSRGARYFYVLQMSVPVVGPTQRPVQRVPGALHVEYMGNDLNVASYMMCHVLRLELYLHIQATDKSVM
jgi:hypothetical protein